MKKRRFLSLLLAALLALALLSPAALAASAPALDVSTDLRLTVSGLAADVQGLQFTMTLDRSEPVTVDFAAGLTGQGIHTACTQKGAEVTVYVTSKSALSEGGRLDVGTLIKSGTAGVSGVSNWKVLTAADLEGETFGPTVTPPVVNPEPPYPPVDDNEPEPPDDSPAPPSGTQRPTKPTTPTKPTPVPDPVLPAAMPFTDVAAGEWYYDAVAYVYRTGLMNGMSETAFVPGGITTRAQIVTILHRLEGEPAASGAGFTDVPDGQWFTAAVRWAAANGIVDGYGDGKFGPTDVITREQMAAILYRYARFKGYSVSAAGDLSVFADVERVSSWAQEAMVWANGCSLITGKSAVTLDPQGSATRAEAATILMRFRESFAQ